MVIPAGVALIYDYAFKECTALRRIEFVNPVKACRMSDSTEPVPGITLIDKTVFRDCESISEVIAPNIGSFTGWMLANL